MQSAFLDLPSSDTHLAKNRKISQQLYEFLVIFRDQMKQISHAIMNVDKPNIKKTIWELQSKKDATCIPVSDIYQNKTHYLESFQ